MRRWQILARHKWICGCVITESDNENRSNGQHPAYRRFTATIRGWRNFKIYEGYLYDGLVEEITGCVEAIRSRIDKGDKMVFHEKGFYIPKEKGEPHDLRTRLHESEP